MRELTLLIRLDKEGLHSLSTNTIKSKTQQFLEIIFLLNGISSMYLEEFILLVKGLMLNFQFHQIK